MKLPPELDFRLEPDAGRTTHMLIHALTHAIQTSQAAQTRWPEQVVHDTVASIARQAAYQRALTDSLWLRFMRWLGLLIRDFREFFAGSPTGRVVAYVLLILVVVLVIARLVINQSSDGPLRIGGALRREHAGGNGPWTEAERLAALGRHTEAAHALFAALLDRFAARGEVRLHPSKTTGDYARELRKKGSPSVGGFAAFRSRYDRVIYGLMECSADDYEALLAEARPLLQSPAVASRTAA